MESETKPFWASKWYFVYLCLFVVVMSVWAYCNFVLHVCFVSGDSMCPTYNDGDILQCSIDFSQNNIKRGDVVVMTVGNKKLVKRVVGLPGESLYIKNGQIYVGTDGNFELSGFEFDKIESPGTLSTDEDAPTVLLNDEYFCVGDNRNNSDDCRLFGPVKFQQIYRVVIKKCL